MLKKIIINISVAGFIILLLLIIGYLFFNNLREKKIRKQVEGVLELAANYIAEKNKRIEELESTPTLTIKEFIKIPCDKKDEEYSKLYDKCEGYKSELNIAFQTIDLLNETLKKSYELSKEMDFGISPYVMFGIGNLKDYILSKVDLPDFNLTIGIDFIKYFFENRLALIAGPYVTIIQDIEVGAKLGFLISFKKNK